MGYWVRASRMTMLKGECYLNDHLSLPGCARSAMICHHFSEGCLMNLCISFRSRTSQCGSSLFDCFNSITALG